jgi:hypothetical protein
MYRPVLHSLIPASLLWLFHTVQYDRVSRRFRIGAAIAKCCRNKARLMWRDADPARCVAATIACVYRACQGGV